MKLSKRILTVNADDEHTSLAALVADRLALPRPEAFARLAAGAVYLDGQRCVDGSRRLIAGQRVVVFEPQPAPRAAPPGAAAHGPPDTCPAVAAGEPTVVYRDRQLAVLDKPAGLASTLPRRGAAETVESFVRRALGPQARLMHRLDQAASGLLLVSCAASGRAELARQVAEHRLQRRYLALAAGVVSAGTRWTARTLLTFDGFCARRADASAGAREAVSHFEVLRSLGGTPARWLLAAELQTGRTHQIRAQLAEAGLPLLGDSRYGGLPAPRLCLHAHVLGLRVPTGRYLQLHSPLPAELRALLAEATASCQAHATGGAPT